MRRVALLPLCFLLLVLEGSLGRVLSLEIMRPNFSYLLTIFVAYHLGARDGAILVFVFGLLQDSFSGLPFGMSGSVCLAIWVLVRWSHQFLLSTRRSVQMGVVLVMSLIANLLTAMLLVLMNVGTPIVMLLLKYAVPLALVEMLFCLPVWGLARWTIGVSKRAGLARAE
jgi:rod shape-determining protein MreD